MFEMALTLTISGDRDNYDLEVCTEPDNPSQYLNIRTCPPGESWETGNHVVIAVSQLPELIAALQKYQSLFGPEAK